MSQGRRCVTASAGDTISSLSPESQQAADKAVLRRRLRQLRTGLTACTRRRCAWRAAAHLLVRRHTARARHVAVYLSVGSELPTAPLIAALRRRMGTVVWVPVIGRAGTMHFVRLGRGRLRRDRSGMPVPAGARARRGIRRMDLVVTPLLGFDSTGSRLGSGRGHYDRALAGRRGHRPWLVGYAYAAQEVSRLPAEPWDVRLDAVCTESGYRRLRGQ